MPSINVFILDDVVDEPHLHYQINVSKNISIFYRVCYIEGYDNNDLFQNRRLT